MRNVEIFVFTDGHFVTDTGDSCSTDLSALRRHPGPRTGSRWPENWVAALESGSLTLHQAADGFTSSPEFQSKYGNLDNAGFVDLLYDNVLGRDPDPAGFRTGSTPWPTA